MQQELAASIAHEVRQPLAAVIANANACLRWLAAEPPNIAEARDAVRRIVRDAGRAREVIGRVLSSESRAAPRRSALDVKEVLEEAATLMRDEARARTVTVRVEAPPPLPAVRADRIELLQVLLNLIRNGIEAMSSIADRPRLLDIRAERHGMDAILVAVCDSGPGLDPRDRERIFDAFYTTKPDGMGIGLAISRSIIEAHGGRLWTVPSDGRGATFMLTLPIEAPDTR